MLTWKINGSAQQKSEADKQIKAPNGVPFFVRSGVPRNRPRGAR